MAVSFPFSHFCCFLLVMALFRLCLSNSDLSDVLCIDEEGEALVEFKQGLVDKGDRLGSWDAGKKTDCCNWVGIVCDNSTGHVQKIHLPGNYCYIDDLTTEKDYEECLKQRLSGNLSASLMHLKQLKHLDLSSNDFEGIQIPEFIGSLGNLRYLNLSRSGFGGTIPPQLGNLTELRILCLGNFYNGRYESEYFSSMRNMHWLSSLGGLRHLDMSGVDLSEATDWLQVINTLPSLVELHLSYSRLPNTHPHVFGLNLTSLALLDLSDNDFFNSSLPQWVFSINTLVSLDLSRCYIQYYSPSIDIFRNLTSLESLDVSHNDFMNSSLALKGLSSVGSNLVSLDISWCGISSSVLRGLHNLTSLLTLDLSENELTETIPKSLANLCNLRHIDLEDNDFTNISLTSHLQSFFECKQPRLESLFFGSSGLSGQLPYEIRQLTYLVDLQLQNNLFSGPIPDSSLESLHLSNNLISGPIPASIGGLSSLKSLDLYGNRFSGPIPDSIGGLSSLESLHLSNNLISGPIPASIGGLSSLKSLDLYGNRFSGPIPDSIGGLSSLESLHLSNNLISGPIPDSIGCLSSLESLHLSNNLISGPIPDSIGCLSSLMSLYLQNNLISGPIPYSFGRLSSLERLDVSDNQLNGSLPDSLGQLSKLDNLYFSNNLLTGVVTKSHLVELARLKVLNGGGNHLTLRSHLANWIPTFQLWFLNLSCWDLGPQFPSWLQVHTDLIYLVISNTRISSLVPDSFWRSFPNLRYLDMSHNHIQGILPGIAASLSIFDVSSNDFGGQLPQLSNTSWALLLDLSNNSFTGSLRNLLCPNSGKELQLQVLNLANNHLSGSDVIPECWLRWPDLSYLNLANNNLSGRIPTGLGSLSSLEALNMCNNKLSGRLHVSIKNLKKLQILQLAGNKLEGRIPEWFGRELPSLKILNLRSNKFDGNITHQLCNLTTVQILELADNNLSGNIPRCFNNFRVLTGKETKSEYQFVYNSNYSDKDVLGSASLVIKGREDTYSTILGLVMILDLSGNNFSGHIPTEIMALKALHSLNLSRNQLTGRIPENIGYLRSLESLDLSLNSLSGELPVSLSSLSFLSCFNVSYNNLTGRVPSSTQLQGFTESSFLGNKLCGEPLAISCAIQVPDTDQEEDNNGPKGADWGLIISIVSGFIAGFWVVLIPLIVNTKWRIAYFNFLSGLRYVVSDAIHKYWYIMFA